MNHHSNLFFGFEVAAPWPEAMPSGRIISPTSRHLTVLFLGKHDPAPILSKLNEMPLPSFPIGATSIADSLLFLPPKNPHVVAYHLTFLSGDQDLLACHAALHDWFKGMGFNLDARPFLPHVTLARAPYDQEKWKKGFEKIPLITSKLHLYQSQPNLTYTPIWTFPIAPPLEPISHTGDLAFRIQSKNLSDLYLHAQLALAFEAAPFLNFLDNASDIQSLEDLIIRLNRRISAWDEELGSPIKAVSFSGNLNHKEGLLSWEMIVDV